MAVSNHFTSNCPSPSLTNVEAFAPHDCRWNRARGRKIYKSEVKEGLKIHRSVKTRLEAYHLPETANVFSVLSTLSDNSLKYIPKVRPNIPKSKGGKGGEPTMLKWEEWNVDNPVAWKWVD